jgi:hypothetical protein
MPGLLLHCGARPVTRTELATLPIPEARGPRHLVRPFIDDVNLVHDYLDSRNIFVDEEAYGITLDNDMMPARFFGLLQVQVDNFDGRDGYGVMIGLRGSYNQTLTRSLAVGSRVFVCDNLAFSGEINLSTKQTTNIGQRLPAMLADAIDRVPVMAEQQSNRFESYRNYTLTKTKGDHLLIECVRRDILPPSHLNRAIREWDKPSHEEHTTEGRTLWRIHNAVTEAIKPTDAMRINLPTTWDRTRKMTDLFDETVGLNRHPTVYDLAA